MPMLPFPYSTAAAPWNGTAHGNDNTTMFLCAFLPLNYQSYWESSGAEALVHLPITFDDCQMGMCPSSSEMFCLEVM